MSAILERQEEYIDGVPVCAANFISPVVDTAYYIGEVHYKIGDSSKPAFDVT